MNNEANGLPYQIASLGSYDGFTADDENALEILWANAFSDSTTSRVKAAAFQTLTWELANDSSIDLSAGNFMLNEDDPHAAGVPAQASTWYAYILNGS